MDIHCAIIIGSYLTKDKYIDTLSDIDICAFSNNFNNYTLEDIAEIIINSGEFDFKDKKPKYKDNPIEKSVEFYIVLGDYTYDITILPNDIPVSDKLACSSYYDSFEGIIGTLYLHSSILFGTIPNNDLIRDKFLPFYDENLRNKRLNVLVNRLISYKEKLNLCLQQKSDDIIDYLCKFRIAYIKFIFILNKCYYIHPEKHLVFQMKKFLNLQKNKIDILMLVGNQDYLLKV